MSSLLDVVPLGVSTHSATPLGSNMVKGLLVPVFDEFVRINHQLVGKEKSYLFILGVGELTESISILVSHVAVNSGC